MRLLSLLFVPICLLAQHPARIATPEQIRDQIRTAFLRAEYQKVLSLQDEHRFSAHFSIDDEEMNFYKASSAARLLQADGEKNLKIFLDHYTNSAYSDLAKVELGIWYHHRGNFDASADWFGRADFRALKPEDRVRARFLWGYGYFSQKKLKESLSQFNQVKLSDGAYGPAASYYAGFAEFYEGDVVTSLADLRRIENVDSYSRVVPHLIAQILNKLGSDDELLKYIATVENKSGLQNAAEIKLLGAEANFRKGNFSSALAGYQAYLKSMAQKDKSILFRAGLSGYRTGSYNTAIDYLKKVASDKDSLGRHASYYLAAGYLRQGQKQLALTAFQSARSGMEQGDMFQECSYQEGKLLYELGRPDEAITAMEDFTSKYPDNLHVQEIRELLSGAYVNASNYHKAIEHIEKLQKRTAATDKAYQKATLFRGYEFYNKADYTGAKSYFDKSLTVPQDPALAAEAHLWLGEIASVEGKLEEAIASYEKVVTNTSSPEATLLRARYGMGYAMFNLRSYENFLFNFREFVKRAPDNHTYFPDALIRFGDCLYATKAYAEAYSQYRRAVQIGRVAVDYAKMQSGIMLGILRRYVEGIDMLSQVIKGYPGSVYWDEAMFHRSQLEFEQSRYGDARDGYTFLIDSKPTSRFVPFAKVRRAASNFNLKAYSLTADDYISVIKDFPGHPAGDDILLPLQEALELAGRGSEFDQYLQLYREQNPDARGIETVEFERAKSYYFNQQYSDAVRSLSGYLSRYPESPRISEARFYLAETHYRLKDYTAALPVYQLLSSDRSFASANRVAARLAEIHFRAGRYEEALLAYRALLSLATSPKDKATAWTGIMETSFFTGSYDSAMMYAERILSDESVGVVQKNKAGLMTGKVYQSKGDFEKAQDAFLSTINDAQDESGAEASYHFAEIQFALKNHQQCYETVIAMNRDFGNYPEWVGRGFLLLAESFAASGEVFQAKATLKSLEKFPLNHIRDQAIRQLRLLEQEESKKNNVPTDSTQNEH